MIQFKRQNPNRKKGKLNQMSGCGKVNLNNNRAMGDQKLENTKRKKAVKKGVMTVAREGNESVSLSQTITA